MATEELIFKHPPVAEVQLAVGFPNNFEVADHRSRFHALVRAEFPNVIIPEQNKLTFDFADYTLQTQDGADRVEVGMNYFRLASVRYPGFGKFRDLFLNTLGIFTKCYEIKSLALLSMSYRNNFPLEPGHKYADCFALGVNVPDSLESELFAGQGVLVFQKPEGFVTIQLEPKVEGTQIQSYLMNLIFSTRPDVPGPFDKEVVPALASIAHDYLKRFFIGVLQPPYLKYLRAR